MKDFQPLIGEWHGEGEVAMKPPMKISMEAKIERLEGSTWKIWRAPGEDWNGPKGPGFNQRFIGEISADGKTIEGRWERGTGDAGDEWGIDFPINYFRK
jgi:hypothetical protein